MFVEIDVVDASGRVVATKQFQEPEFSVGGSPRDELQVPGAKPSWFVFKLYATRCLVRTKLAPGQVGEWRVLPPVITVDLGEYKLNVRLHGLPKGSGRGDHGCPRCSGSLIESETGGAYRSVAKRTRECRHCGCRILKLHESADVLGAFSDATSLDWFKPTAEERCPDCMQPMHKSVFRTQAGEATVERCTPCNVILLEPADLEQLTEDAPSLA